MKLLIYGFGRMGLTHYSILNSLLPDASFTFIDPNKLLNLIGNKNVKGDFVMNDEYLKAPFDLTLITTPPLFHREILNNSLSRGDKNIFVEKPFGGHANLQLNETIKNVFVGYVLRFNPIVNWIKDNINPNDVVECYSEYLSNTIENKPTGWRNGAFSGVLNEMGSHILDMNNYLFDISGYQIQSKEIYSHISDVDDEVKFKIESDHRMFEFYFNWVDKTIRKPIFNVKLKLKNNTEITFDQQKIKLIEKGTIRHISIVELEQNIPYYLRGVDFTKQMEDLIQDRKILCSAPDAIFINKLMNEILAK